MSHQGRLKFLKQGDEQERDLSEHGSCLTRREVNMQAWRHMTNHSATRCAFGLETRFAAPTLPLREARLRTGNAGTTQAPAMRFNRAGRATATFAAHLLLDAMASEEPALARSAMAFFRRLIGLQRDGLLHFSTMPIEAIVNAFERAAVLRRTEDRVG